MGTTDHRPNKYPKTIRSVVRVILPLLCGGWFASLPTLAQAAPINYVWGAGSYVILGDTSSLAGGTYTTCGADPACSAAYGVQTEAVSGSFTFDPTTDTASNTSITLTGGSPYSGTYTFPGPTSTTGRIYAFGAGPDPTDPTNPNGATLFIDFLAPLNGTPTTLSQFGFQSEFPGHGNVSVIGYGLASVAPTPVSAFEVFELAGGLCPNLPSGDTGCFDLVNNTTDYTISGFEVGNNLAISDSTTRSNWNASITSVDYGSGPEQSFAYFDAGGIDANPLGNGSDGNFFFTSAEIGSPFEIFANGPNGAVTCSGVSGGGCDPAGPAPVPEPGTLSLLGSALISVVLIRRRKRSVCVTRRHRKIC